MSDLSLSPQATRSLRVTLYVLFVLSGGAGLIYESLWARYLGLFVGHTAYAQILVLGIFLGGMSLGAALISSRTRGLRDPLKWYAWAEVAVGVIGVAFHDIYGVVTNLAYDSIFPALGTGGAVHAVKWTISCLLILPQSILLGATFPLMTAGVLRRFDHTPGQTISVLYFANSFGAAIGVLLAGFWLLKLAGLPGTLLVAAIINLCVALAALAVAQQYPASPTEPDSLHADAGALEHAEPMPLARLTHLMIAVAGGTAVASFVYEIGWIRMLSLVLGSATHSFELMLSAFIMGIALGALWVRRRADQWRRPIRSLAVIQWMMGAAALATLPLYAESFEWMVTLMRTFARTDSGYSGFAVARYGIALAIMLPATFCAGMTLPLITKILVVRGAGEREIGRVYSVNTLGSIIGVTVAGLVLISTIGLKAMLIAGAALDMVLGVVVFAMLSKSDGTARRLVYAASATAAAVVAWAAVATELDWRLLTSAVYRVGSLPREGQFEKVYYRDGRTATVSVQRGVENRRLTIATNGKPDASLPSFWNDACTADGIRRPLSADPATQALAPLITLAYAPNARRGAIIGHGSGMSSHLVLGHPEIESLVTIELEPSMVEGSRAFLPSNRRVFEDPRSTIVIDDAKSFFAAGGDQFDYIFSEPSNPWVSGVASLFTLEFYARLRTYLTDDGVFGQWLHLYEIDDGLVLSILAAIHQSFPSYVLYLTNATDLLVVAAASDSVPAPDWSIFESEAIRTDLCHIHRPTATMLEAAKVLDRAALAPLLGSWPGMNSDFYPVLDLGAERSRYLGRSATGFVSLSGARFDIAAPFFGTRSRAADDPTPLVEGVIGMQRIATRTQLDTEAGDVGTDPQIGQLRDVLEEWDVRLRSRRPPNDWRRWFLEFTLLETSLHGGMHGLVREDFYRDVDGFLVQVNAPEDVRTAVDFVGAIGRWDFQSAARLARDILPDVMDGDALVDQALVLDGGVIANIAIGDPAQAQQIFTQLAPRTSRSPNDLRLQLLQSYIDGAMAEQSQDFDP